MTIPFLSPTSQRKALVIGCANYLQKGSINYNYVISNGVISVSERLKTHEDGSQNFSVTKLSDKDGELPYSSKEDLMCQIENFLAQDATSDDVGLFYFIGHGTKDGDICLPGSKSDSYDITIPMKRLQEMINVSKFGRLFVIIDCCYSGKILVDIKSPLRPGVCIVTSANGDEKAYAKIRRRYPKLKLEDCFEKYSLFTGFFIDALGGRAADRVTGFITLPSVFNYIAQNVGVLQHPSLYCSLTDNVPLRLHKTDYDARMLYAIYCFFRTNDTDQWPEDSRWLTAYTRMENLDEEDLKCFNEVRAKLLEYRYVKLRDNGLKKSGKEESFYMLTARGQQLWDMVQMGYYKLSVDDFPLSNEQE